MRIEQITAAAARLVINPVCEIARVETFATAFSLSFWHTRMSLGLSCYRFCPMGLARHSCDSTLRRDPSRPNAQHGIKRGNLLHQMCLVPATCPAGNATA